jgi:peptide-methionine (R)-S-oxide reductase
MFHAGLHKKPESRSDNRPLVEVNELPKARRTQVNRRTLLQCTAATAALPLLSACSKTTSGMGDASQSSAAVKMLDRPHSFWRDHVSPAAYEVLFEEETEAPFSSPLNKENRTGTFVCAACNQALFDSTTKFESGTGWPSFTRPIPGHMATKTDFKLVWPRTEYHCARCGGHQGHLFDDGPAPRGERWCNNGLALAFVPQGEPLPALRG